MKTKTKKRVLDNLQTLWDSCQEALNNEWDRGDDGFEAMQMMIETITEIIKKEK